MPSIETDLHPQFLAWRIQLRVIPDIERRAGLGATAETELNGLCCTNQVMDEVSPFPGQTYPTVSVTGMPSAVKPFRTATRIWNSAT